MFGGLLVLMISSDSSEGKTDDRMIEFGLYQMFRIGVLLPGTSSQL